MLCSFICDELDGRFARMFGQTTILGQVLDMVTDRCIASLIYTLRKWYACRTGLCSPAQYRKVDAAVRCVLSMYLSLCRLSTAGLLVVLSILNRKWYFCFLVLLMLDIFSHWFQMYATLAAGAATHKVCQLLSVLICQTAQHMRLCDILHRPDSSTQSLVALLSVSCAGSALAHQRGFHDKVPLHYRIRRVRAPSCASTISIASSWASAASAAKCCTCPCTFCTSWASSDGRLLSW